MRLKNILKLSSFAFVTFNMHTQNGSDCSSIYDSIPSKPVKPRNLLWTFRVLICASFGCLTIRYSWRRLGLVQVTCRRWPIDNCAKHRLGLCFRVRSCWYPFCCSRFCRKFPVQQLYRVYMCNGLVAHRTVRARWFACWVLCPRQDYWDHSSKFWPVIYQGNKLKWPTRRK